MALPHPSSWPTAATIIFFAGAITFSTPASGVPAPGPEKGPKVQPIDIETRWLPNGLRVVTIAGPWPEHRVSIRLVIRGGALTADGRAEQYGTHFVEHLAFNRTGTESDVFSAARAHGGHANAHISMDCQLHEFDTDSNFVPRALAGILAEWDYDRFYRGDVERERQRILHELGFSAHGPSLSVLARSLMPSSPLAYSEVNEREFVDTVSARTLRRVFEKRFAAHRLTLIVAAHARTLERLSDAIDAFDRVPQGEEDSGWEAHRLSWLSGDLRTNARDVAGNYIGLRFSEPDRVPSHVRFLISLGISEYVPDALEEKGCEAADFEQEACYTPSEEIWAFLVTRASCRANGEPSLYGIVEESLEYLASPASLDWWKSLLARDAEEYGLITDSPAAVADEVSSHITETAQDVSAPSWTDYACPADPRIVTASLRGILDRAVIFRVYGKRAPTVVENDENEFDPSLVNLMVLDTQNDPFWSAVTFFAVLMTASAGIAVVGAYLMLSIKSKETALHRWIGALRKRGTDER